MPICLQVAAAEPQHARRPDREILALETMSLVGEEAGEDNQPDGGKTNKPAPVSPSEEGRSRSTIDILLRVRLDH